MRQAIREGKKIRKVTVANLSHWDKEQFASLKPVFEGNLGGTAPRGLQRYSLPVPQPYNAAPLNCSAWLRPSLYPEPDNISSPIPMDLRILWP